MQISAGLGQKNRHGGAEKHPDVIAVIGVGDVPGNIKMGHIVPDWGAFTAEGQTTRYVGDAIVMAVSARQETLDEILALVFIELLD